MSEGTIMDTPKAVNEFMVKRGWQGRSCSACGRMFFSKPSTKKALSIELHENGIPFEREVEIPIVYRDRQLACTYRADFVCFGDIIVELKAIKQITEVERAQTINYLKATGKKRGMLLNFGAASLQKERFAN